MATIPKRLLTVCLALAFFIGATVQVLPSSMAIGEVGAGVNVFDDSTVVLHGQYTYSVTAFNGAGESAHSHSVDIEVGA